MKRSFSREFARNAVLGRGWLANVSDDFRDTLLDAAQQQHYDAGAYTHHIGDGPGGIFGVVDGSFAVLGPNPSMGVVMGHVYRRGGWFGEGPAVLGTPRMLSFRALETSVVLHVPLAALERIQQRPEHARMLVALVARNSWLVTRALSDLLTRRSDQRIAAVLLRVTGADEEGTQDSDQAPAQVTQADLAELANSSRHTVNAVLRKFQDCGWVNLGYGRISVRDAQGLRRFLVEDR